jgi:Saxitoxin biosynthesis operon protein SxtJ
MRLRRLTRGSANPGGEQHHESLAGDHEAPLPSDRSVGLAFTAAAMVVGLVPWLRGGSPRVWAVAAAVGFLLLALARPRWLHPLNRAWMAFGQIANTTVSSVLMAVIFYGVVTPLAWALRRTGHDLLRLRFEPGATSYWLERPPPGAAPETMKNQF